MRYFLFKTSIGSIIFLFLAIFLPKITLSQSVSTFYGGQIQQVTYCTCYYDLATVIKVKDLATNQDINLKYSIYQSRLFSQYNIWTQNNCVVGSYTRGSAKCQDTKGYYCQDNTTVANADGTINMLPGIGTSASTCTTS